MYYVVYYYYDGRNRGVWMSDYDDAIELMLSDELEDDEDLRRVAVLCDGITIGIVLCEKDAARMLILVGDYVQFLDTDRHDKMCMCCVRSINALTGHVTINVCDDDTTKIVYVDDLYY